jgi:hypothetical protein
MNLPGNEPGKLRIGPYAIGVLLVVVAGAILLVSDTATHRPLAMVALILSGICIRKSRNYPRPGSLVAAPFRKFVVIVSIILVPLVGTSYASLYYFNMRDGTQVWPVYLFGAIAFICTIFWSLLVAMSV